MAVSYNKLWKLLIDKQMNKGDLRKAAQMSPNSLAKLGKNENEEASLYMDRTIVIEQDDGCRNEVRIEKGRVYMAFSTCENQNCVNQGEMTPDNIASRALSNWIICLPNRVTVELGEE